jgi:predicted transposase YbfD/YdcC
MTMNLNESSFRRQPVVARALKAGSSVFVHMVSAWATNNGVVLGQVKTGEKSNEIAAIPRLLKLLNIKGCLVTIDAMGCQKQIGSDIQEAGADYLPAVKDNQPTLNAEVTAIFEHCRREPTAFGVDFHETRNTGHGRTEIRRCWTTDMVESLSQHGEWKGLQSLVMIEAERTVDGKTSTEHRYYISSCKSISAQSALQAARKHWGIENELHWVLDVVFREDDCRVRAGNRRGELRGHAPPVPEPPQIGQEHQAQHQTTSNERRLGSGIPHTSPDRLPRCGMMRWR